LSSMCRLLGRRANASSCLAFVCNVSRQAYRSRCMPPRLLQKHGLAFGSSPGVGGVRVLTPLSRPCTVTGTVSLCKGVWGVYLTLIRIIHTSNRFDRVSLQFRYIAMGVFMSDMSVQVTGVYERLVAEGEISQEEARALVALDVDLEELEGSLPVYLELPEPLGLFKGDARYQAGLPVGFLYYRDDQAADGSVEGDGLSSPWERDEILEMMHHSIHHPDPKQAALLPLAFNVGCMMGFLSALAVQQQEDAQVGLVLLNMMVSPLLVSSSVQMLQSGREASSTHGDAGVPRCAAPGCNNPLNASRTGRPSRFCSGACRVRAYRAKSATEL